MQRYLRTSLIVGFVLSFMPAAFAQKNEGLGVVAPQKPQLDATMPPPPMAAPAPAQTLGSAPPPTSPPKAAKKRTKPPSPK